MENEYKKTTGAQWFFVVEYLFRGHSSSSTNSADDLAVC